ncbi:1-acyl-sn-glycerol-3-phosphate acyltransferase [Aerococcaceae bacterium zg-BR22]|uniref:lysophospholipid acyltransferase family protein n=1 Tax=Aerococcaceae bacterium zg-1292 TaxID=2774330 RepID=UPI004063ECF2|nr:1-acyl-sn-glycerol-3-phosphate acyltransferase [Aerococcaceae bacterium zg-BR22]
MSFYQFAVHIIKFIIRLFNGRPVVTGLENIPENQSVIIAGTHRSLTDPFFIADIVYPREVAFMAKSNLFNNKLLAKMLTAGKVFPVNREKPSTSSIKHAVNVLKDGSTLGIFPSGSRHTTEIKGGTAFIQKLSKAPIVPVAIQPPIGFWQFITRKKAKIAFGTPIVYNPEIKYDKATLAAIDLEIATQFEQLDAKIDPLYQYIPKSK